MTARVVVLGASSALGRATCRELIRRDARVAGTYFSRADWAEGALSAVLSRRADLSTPSGTNVVGELAHALGGADALVYCAALASASGTGDRYDRLEDVDPEAFARLLAVNVTGALLAVRAFAKTPGAPRRNVVLVGSVDGAKSLPTAVPYAASKGALVAMARALAKELAPSGILVNVIAPGMLTHGLTELVPSAIKAEYLKHSAQKRFGTHEEVARSIAWFALSNTYVTGQTLTLDGGL